MKHLHIKNELTIKGAGGGGAPSPPGPVAVQMFPAVLAPPLMGETSYISSFSYAEIVDLISDGPIEGIINKDFKKVYGSNIFEGIYLNGVPVKETSRISSEKIDIEFLRRVLKKIWQIDNQQDYGIPLTPFVPLEYSLYTSDPLILKNPFFSGKVDIVSYHPNDSLVQLVNSLNLDFDSVKLAQKAFDSISSQDEVPFLTIVSIPELISPIFSSKFVKNDYDDSVHGLKLDINNLADYIYFTVDNQSLNLNQYSEIPRTFITATKEKTNPTSLKNGVVPISGYEPIKFTNIKIYIWSVYNKKTGIKNISKAFDKYFNSINITQLNRSLYNFNLIKSEFKNGSEFQYPLKDFRNVEVDIEFNKELVGPFKLLNNQKVNSAKTSNQGGVSRLLDLCCVDTNFPVSDPSKESSDDVRFVCNWPVEYDQIGTPLIISGVRFNYALFDQTSRSRVDQHAVPVTHYIENNNVEQVYVTLNLNTLHDTNHIDLVSAGYGTKPNYTETPYEGAPTYQDLVNQKSQTIIGSTVSTQINTTYQWNYTYNSATNVLTYNGKTIPTLTRYIGAVVINKFIDWSYIFPASVKSGTDFSLTGVNSTTLKTNINPIAYPYVSRFATEYAQALIARGAPGALNLSSSTVPVELIGVNYNYLSASLKIVGGYISIDMLNTLLDKFYKYKSTTFGGILTTFENGKLVGYSTVIDSNSADVVRILSSASGNDGLFNTSRTNYSSSVYFNYKGYSSVSATYDLIYKYGLVSKSNNASLAPLKYTGSSKLDSTQLTRKQQITAGTKLPAVVSVKVETGYESNENSNYVSTCEYFAYQFDIYGMAQEPAYIDIGRRSYSFLRGRMLPTNPNALVYNVDSFNYISCFHIFKIYFYTDPQPIYKISSTRDFSYQGICFRSLEERALESICRLNENQMFGLQKDLGTNNGTSTDFVNQTNSLLIDLSSVISNAIYDEDKINLTPSVFTEFKKISFLNLTTNSSPVNFIECSSSINELINQSYKIDTYRFNNMNGDHLCVAAYSFSMKSFDTITKALIDSSVNLATTTPVPTANHRFFAISYTGSSSKIIAALNKVGYKYLQFSKSVSAGGLSEKLILVSVPTSSTGNASIETLFNATNYSLSSTEKVVNYSKNLYVENAGYGDSENITQIFSRDTSYTDFGGYLIMNWAGGIRVPYYNVQKTSTVDPFTLTSKTTAPRYYTINTVKTFTNLPEYSELINFSISVQDATTYPNIDSILAALSSLTFKFQSNIITQSVHKDYPFEAGGARSYFEFKDVGKGNALSNYTLPENSPFLDYASEDEIMPVRAFTLTSEIKVTEPFSVGGISKNSFQTTTVSNPATATPVADQISIVAKFWTLYNQKTNQVSVVFADPTKAAKWAQLEDDLLIRKLPIVKLLQSYYAGENYYFYGSFIAATYQTLNYYVTSEANLSFYADNFNNLNILKYEVGGKMAAKYPYNGGYFKFNPNSFGMVAKSSFGGQWDGKPYNDGGYAYYRYSFKHNVTTPSLYDSSKNLRILTRTKLATETVLDVASSLLKSSLLGVNAVPADAFFSSTSASPKVSQTWNNANTLTKNTYGYKIGSRGLQILSTVYVNGDGSESSTAESQTLTISYYEIPMSNFALASSNSFTPDGGQDIFLPPPKNDASGSPIRRYVKVTKLSYETLSPLINKKISLAKITEIIPQKFSYPFSSIMGIKIDSRSFSQMPSRSYHCKLKKVLVPSNYFPINPVNEMDIRYEISERGKYRIYEGDWDGTFKLMWTDNPAWILMDMLVNRRYGLGNYISSEQVDIWELYKVSRWCDGVDDNGYYFGVLDGYGGVEPRHTFNALIGDKFNVFDMINQIASVFRGHVYYMNSLVTFDDDRPKPPIGEFSNSDVKDGIFNYTNLKKDDEFTAVEIAFVDSKNDYRSSIEYVEDSEGIRKRGILKKQINAFGITSRGQARRFGKHFLYQTSKENLNVAFTTDIKALLYKPGDLIRINDELLNQTKNFGSVKAIEEIPNTGELFKVVIDKILDSGVFNDQEINLYTALAKPRFEDMNNYLSNSYNEDMSFEIWNGGPFMKDLCKIMMEDPKAIQILSKDLSRMILCDAIDYQLPLSGTLFHPFIAETFVTSTGKHIINRDGYVSHGPDPRDFYTVQIKNKDLNLLNLGTGIAYEWQNMVGLDRTYNSLVDFYNDGLKYVATGSSIKCVPKFLDSAFFKKDKYTYTGHICIAYNAFTTEQTFTARHILRYSEPYTHICVGPLVSSKYFLGCVEKICCILTTFKYVETDTFTNNYSLDGHWLVYTGDNIYNYVELDTKNYGFDKKSCLIDCQLNAINTGAYIQYNGTVNGEPTWLEPVFFNPEKPFYENCTGVYDYLLKTKTGRYCLSGAPGNITIDSNPRILNHFYIDKSGQLASSTDFRIKGTLPAHLRSGYVCTDFDFKSKIQIRQLKIEDNCPSLISYQNIIQPHRPSIETFIISGYKTGFGVSDQTSDSYCSNLYTELFLCKFNSDGYLKDTVKNGLSTFIVGSPYSLQILNKNIPSFKIMSITENYINEYNIMATEYREDKFKEIEDNIEIDYLQNTFNALYYYQSSSRISDQNIPLKSPIINSITKVDYLNMPTLQIVWTPASEHIRSVGGVGGTKYRIYVQSPSKQTPNLQATVGDEAYVESEKSFKYVYQGDGLINPLLTEVGTYEISIEAFYEKDGIYLFSTPTKRIVNLLSY